MSIYDRTFAVIPKLLDSGAKRVPKTLLNDFQRVYGFGKLKTVHDIQMALTEAATKQAKVSTEFKEYLLENQDKFRPKFFNGHWRKAEFPAAKRSILRRQAERLGLDCPENQLDKRNERIIKFKGHKWERAKEAKQAKITAALETMDAKIEAYHKSRREYRKELSDVQLLFRLPDPKKQSTSKPKKGGAAPQAQE